MLSFSDSFVADIIPRAKENIRPAAMMLFQIVPKYSVYKIAFCPTFVPYMI